MTRFVDAQQMHRKHPKRFWAPEKELLDQIQAGDLVKVAVEFGDAEPGFFWITVTGKPQTGNV